jgi:hypothetical protein
MAFSYSPKIIVDGLVLYLDAANRDSYPGSGTVWNDISRSGNNGTLTNGPTFNTGSLGSIVFDGVDDYVNVGVLSPINNSTSLTLCYWAKKQASDKDMVIGSQVTSNTNGIWLQWYSDGNIYFSPRNGSNTGISYSLSYDSDWKYFCGTYSNSSGIIYVNGLSVKTGTGLPSSLSSTAGNSFRVGDLRDLFYSTGNISSVQIYNRALTPSEVLQNYNAQKSRFGLT